MSDNPRGPMDPKGEVCDTRLGYLKGPMPSGPSRMGRYGADAPNEDGGDGRTQGLPEGPPRSGRFGGMDGEKYGQ